MSGVLGVMVRFRTAFSSIVCELGPRRRRGSRGTVVMDSHIKSVYASCFKRVDSAWASFLSLAVIVATVRPTAPRLLVSASSQRAGWGELTAKVNTSTAAKPTVPNSSWGRKVVAALKVTLQLRIRRYGRMMRVGSWSSTRSSYQFRIWL